MPLYKLTSLDIRDTALVDCATGETLYRTSTPVASPRSRASSITSWASSSRSQEKLPLRDQCTTAVLDREGQIVAEIVWEGTHTPEIRIGDEVLKGTGELFDAAFVRVLPDETFLPTRMEYTWRITPETLTLLDDDGAVVGRLYADCAFSKGRPVPALRPHTGLDYLELHTLMSEDLLEVIVSYLLVTTLRERLFSVTKYVYGGQRKRPLSTLRSHATRSFVSLRDSIRHSISPMKHHH
ncbi:uncharacterized protein TRAVEDRAFT_119142 [Trametes versicolor FP-101664 SS1]|uniref:uncharacterized protein n=1 Tax=Trametes versicolor (strain FP-101664) TaxID=717944 RepID=UPI00046235E7|nr:uncharacterized protein TRAVEDRAFT_119142 [Trametes versicolor FP-101664 SS1]EIW60315.1 hypothetical protein TRAVEDRAFT_119142 [Trametes versicolor FP-101664 SS1]